VLGHGGRERKKQPPEAPFSTAFSLHSFGKICTYRSPSATPPAKTACADHGDQPVPQALLA
jgi:hypothetical protein